MKNRKYCIECGKLRDGDNPYWCKDCDKKRIEKISLQMEQIALQIGINTEAPHD